MFENALRKIAEKILSGLKDRDQSAIGLGETIDDNIQCAALLFAAIESARTGKVVDVQEYLRSCESITNTV